MSAAMQMMRGASPLDAAVGRVAVGSQVAADAAVVSDAQQMEALLISRTYLYTLFHKLLGGHPDATLLQTLLDPMTFDVVDEYAPDDPAFAALAGFLRMLARVDQRDLLDNAGDEYTRIFIGPANLPASPYESPYTGTHDLALFQQNTLDVRAAYHAAGLRLRREQAVPDDHVSLLCAYMAICSRRAWESFRNGDAPRLAQALRQQDSFVQCHLANWLGEYAARVRNSQAGDRAVLYPQMLEAAAAFANDDAVFVKEAAFWVEGLDGIVPGSSASFAAVEAALARLESLRLAGLGENELTTID